jgi:hypothetical protein
LVELETDIQAENTDRAAGGVLESDVLRGREQFRLANRY